MSFLLPGQEMYLIAILPHTHFDLWCYVKDRQLQFAREFDAHRAWTKPPHVTLFDIIKIFKDKKLALHRGLLSFASHCVRGQLDIDGFGAFGKHTIFLKVVKTLWLTQLRSLINTELLSHLGIRDPGYSPKKPESFYPHMTVGYRDLRPEQFDRAWPIFKDLTYHASFSVNAIFLLKWSIKENRWKKAYEYLLTKEV